MTNIFKKIFKKPTEEEKQARKDLRRMVIKKQKEEEEKRKANRKKHSFRKQPLPVRITTYFMALTLGATAFFLTFSNVLSTADELITDYIYRYNPFEKADSRITIVTIDSASEEAYGSYSDWSRSILADAVDVIAENDASVIGLDLDLSEEKDSEGDEALVTACQNAGDVIVSAGAYFASNQNNQAALQASLPQSDSTEAAELTQDISIPEDTTSDIDSTEDAEIDYSQLDFYNPGSRDMDFSDDSASAIRYPFGALMEVVKVGISNSYQQSSDGYVRSAALSVNYDGEDLSSFSAMMYMAYQDSIGEAYNFPDVNSSDVFQFSYVWDDSSYQTISISDLLSGNYNASELEDRVVLIGQYTETEDYNLIDATKGEYTQQEVVLEASIIQALLTEDVVISFNTTLLAFLYFILFSGIYVLIARNKNYFIAFIQFGLVVAGTLAAYELNALGYRLMLLVPIIVSVLSIIAYLTQNMIFNIIERKKMENTLKMYVDRQIVDQISSVAPLKLASISRRKDIAVLFVDIRGFTTLSETLDPEDVVDVLNQYFTVVYSSIQGWNGTLDKFIGDAAMVIFNAPNDLEDYVFHAVCTAWDIREGFDQIKPALEEKYGITLNVGIGVNCGEAIVGNIGCYGRMDYTAIGDVVNTASRLESKAAPHQILISEKVKEALEGRGNAESVGELNLKGKARAVAAYEVTELDKPELLNPAARKEFLREANLLYSKIKSDIPIPQLLEGKQRRV